METTNIIRFLYLLCFPLTYFDKIFCPYRYQIIYYSGIILGWEWRWWSNRKSECFLCGIWLGFLNFQLLLPNHLVFLSSVLPVINLTYIITGFAYKFSVGKEEMKMGVVLITRFFQLQMVLDSRDHDWGAQNN